MAQDLSAEAKQTFQIVALVSTLLVVGIHYQSAAPTSPLADNATWNELSQEFLLGGLARVAVPLFALAAGLFYFRSDDGTRACYLRKLKQRGRTVLIPYFIIASLATTSWLVVRHAEGDPVQLSMGQFLATWLLRPPAEQLWFLRDLFVLVAIAPVIRRFVAAAPAAYLGFVASIWFFNFQPFPLVAGWHLLNMETLLFFSIGAALVDRSWMVESLGKLSVSAVAGLMILWFDLVVTRIMMRADFDCWYRGDYSITNLLMHKISIVVGCGALFAFCWKIRSEVLVRLSGMAFFVYLVHEFPLRAVVERVAESTMDKPGWFYVTFPTAIVICFVAASLMNRTVPSAVAMLTGGRTPESAQKISLKGTQS